MRETHLHFYYCRRIRETFYLADSPPLFGDNHLGLELVELGP